MPERRRSRSGAGSAVPSICFLIYDQVITLVLSFICFYLVFLQMGDSIKASVAPQAAGEAVKIQSRDVGTALMILVNPL